MLRGYEGEARGRGESERMRLSDIEGSVLAVCVAHSGELYSPPDYGIIDYDRAYHECEDWN